MLSPPLLLVLVTEIKVIKTFYMALQNMVYLEEYSMYAWNVRLKELLSDGVLYK